MDLEEVYILSRNARHPERPFRGLGGRLEPGYVLALCQLYRIGGVAHAGYFDRLLLRELFRHLEGAQDRRRGAVRYGRAVEDVQRVRDHNRLQHLLDG